MKFLWALPLAVITAAMAFLISPKESPKLAPEVTEASIAHDPVIQRNRLQIALHLNVGREIAAAEIRPHLSEYLTPCSKLFLATRNQPKNPSPAIKSEDRRITFLQAEVKEGKIYAYPPLLGELKKLQSDLYSNNT